MEDAVVQLVLFWIGVGFCFIGTVLFVTSFVFKKENLIRYGVISAYVAAVPMFAALALRWMQTGHYPNQGTYEVFSSYGWGVLFFYLIIRTWKPNLSIAGIIVMPVTMLMVGVAVMNSTELTVMPKTYFIFWLWVHMLFAKLSYGSVFISAALSAAYLLKLKQEAQGNVNPLLQKLPSVEKIDYMNYRFIAFSFIMLGIMIGSGAIWAYKVWGRYWGWDPIETWALISWLVYGIYMHMRIVGVKGKLAAWTGIVAVVLVIFTFFGTPFVYDSLHGHVKNADVQVNIDR